MTRGAIKNINLSLSSLGHCIRDSVYRMLWYTARYYWRTSTSVWFTLVYWDM